MRATVAAKFLLMALPLLSQQCVKATPPASTSSDTTAQAANLVRFPPKITPSPEQERLLLEIRSKYLLQMSALESEKARSLATGVEIQRQVAFFRNEEAKIRQEINKAVLALLTPEQKKELGAIQH